VAQSSLRPFLVFTKIFVQIHFYEHLFQTHGLIQLRHIDVCHLKSFFQIEGVSDETVIYGDVFGTSPHLREGSPNKKKKAIEESLLLDCYAT
jgi:hypothetical protein